ncbi:MAG: ACP S-malonyltransferase [Alphaproteobacteria bacterium]|nr:MAG: ACP S-malonyltransferase [Alphaproteobacteria bacterium]
MTGTRTLVVCPGRGTYGKGELGYLKNRHGNKRDLLNSFDEVRLQRGQASIAALDGAERFATRTHGAGDNAAGLIFASAFCDYQDLAGREVVAVVGNSMGWYIALACAGVLPPREGFQLANEMGTLMHETGLGAQLVYSLVDENWREVPGRRAEVLASMAKLHKEPDHRLYISIELGGMIVLAGDEQAISALAKELPVVEERFPFVLQGHSAFHTPLQAPVSEMGQAALAALTPGRPKVPLIDGRGQIWTPYSSDPEALWDYTLGTQVICPYDFTRSVQVAVREYAPEEIVILGPGTTLFGAVAQSLLAIEWRGLKTKAELMTRQKEAPLLHTLGS